MLALGPLGEIADVLDCQRVQMQQLTEPAELIGLRVVQVEPEELMGLQVSGNLVKVVPLDHGARRAAGAHVAQTRTGSGGAGDRRAQRSGGGTDAGDTWRPLPWV